jgi:hypothetical protein
MTVVELEIEPWVSKEGCVNRHLIGVRENLNCYAYPDVGEWNESGSGRFEDEVTYVAPLISDESAIRYVVDGSHYDLDLIIIEPTAVIARSPVAKNFGLGNNVAGGAGMNVQIYVLPETVSFSGISMEEIPSVDGIHEGYFSNTFFSKVWYHTEEMGAGDWTNIKPDNFWATDIATLGEMLPFEKPNGDMTYDASMGNWRNGTITWYIQWGWGEFNSEQGDLPLGIIPKRYDQTFSINNEGTLSISKFGHIVSRGTNNVFYLNGTIVDKSNLIKKD